MSTRVALIPTLKQAENLCRSLTTNKLFFHLMLKSGALANHPKARACNINASTEYSKDTMKWVSDIFEVQIGVYHRVNGYNALYEWTIRALGPLIMAGQCASTKLYDISFSSCVPHSPSDSLLGSIVPGQPRSRAVSQDLTDKKRVKTSECD